MPTPINPDATTAINRYVESTDTRPTIDTFQRLEDSDYRFIDGALLRAEDSLNLMRRNAINLSRLNSLGLPPGGAVERYFVAPATATLKLKQDATETTIPADGTERTVAGIVIKRLADPQGGMSIIEMRAERGQTGGRSFLISGGDVAYPAIDFTIRERNESQAESHFETRQQIMTAALERLQLEQGILSATTDRTQRVRSESNLARLR
ncbi:MAG TPA: hypothetical protein PKV72_04590, partial [Candidatus Peribacteria bacterium]|nr:hypothetical protein [Candidatus Peribacteria bacterium]